MFRIKPKGTQPAWQGSAAAACFVIAVIAGLSGSLLTTNAILNAHEHPKLYAVGLISLIFALPIAILGAHCLDLIDRRQKKIERLLATSRFSGSCPWRKVISGRRSLRSEAGSNTSRKKFSGGRVV